ncbi:MAG TPA: hypothetical protein VFA09_02635 [Ktedonobacteraceae bacterium]|nr:hypothetical protein [Ktedonobacteraceae bacterium]
MTTRNIAYTLLALCLLCGLIAGIFSHPIEAALTLPQMNAALPTPAATQAPGAIPTTPIAPSPAANAPNTLARDTFQRPDQLFWGKASDGQLWTGDANGSDTFSIVRNAGQVNGQPGVYNAILGPASTNAEVLFTASVNHFNPATVNIGAVLRWKDGNNWYKAFINGTELVILKRIAGTTTRLGSVPFSAVDALSYTLRFRAIGATLFAKAWPANTPEPASWMLTVTDTNRLLLSGSAGLRAAVEAGTVVKVTSFLETSVADTI